MNRYANSRVFSLTANSPRTHVIPRMGRTAMEATTSFLQRKKILQHRKSWIHSKYGQLYNSEILNVLAILPLVVHFVPKLKNNTTIRVQSKNFQHCYHPHAVTKFTVIVLICRCFNDTHFAILSCFFIHGLSCVLVAFPFRNEFRYEHEFNHS